MSAAIGALGGNSSLIDTMAGESKIAGLNSKAKTADKSELRSTSDAFVGELFFGQMMESMRKTVGKPAYMHGGRGAEQEGDRLLADSQQQQALECFQHALKSISGKVRR